MQDTIDLDRYPLDRPGTPAWEDLVANCRRTLDADGLFNLPGFLRPAALAAAVAEVRPVLDTAAFTHEREHNIYFQPRVEGLAADHPALTRFRTRNRTVCADQMGAALVVRLYEWPPFAAFLAAAMGKARLWTMDDPLARVNVMAYGDGDTLNWHFDRSEFTTTLLLQAPEGGGAFEYAKDLRGDGDPNHDGVARLIRGQAPTTVLPLEPGTLNVFRGRNTAHRATAVRGATPRIIAVFSYYERPGVTFSAEERLGFYGRAA
ncbi:MAG: 2OG-Fe(II) oxygenase [Hyphomicrobiales bacterium]|nr:2OG-Fe(II) oxygenase [Hyphomicrobiales bacterium]MCP5371284.1 2OG-Fe(II) oxygenase [Hyphomicrobiales bacterium]